MEAGGKSWLEEVDPKAQHHGASVEEKNSSGEYSMYAIHVQSKIMFFVGIQNHRQDNAERLGVVVKKKNPDGTWTVCIPQTSPHAVVINRHHRQFKIHMWLTNTAIVHLFSPARSGGPGLKKTQIYPELYGRRIYRFHKGHTDWDDNSSMSKNSSQC